MLHAEAFNGEIDVLVMLCGQWQRRLHADAQPDGQRWDCEDCNTHKQGDALAKKGDRAEQSGSHVLCRHGLGRT